MLVGRDVELGVVERLLAAARAGSSGSLALVGEAGIGKTALLDEAVRRAGDMHVVRAAGTESERDLPFAGLSQLLRPLLPLVDRIPGPQAEALTRALAITGGPAPDRFAVAAATLSLICRAAEDRPQLLVVDDLHLVDQSSVDALLFAARRLLTDAVVVLAGGRPGQELDVRLADLPRLALTGLADADAVSLVAEGSLPVDLLARLCEITAGNPLAVLEMSSFPDLLLGAAVGVPVPSLIARAFATQLDLLGGRTRQALVVAAAAGDVELATLAAACTATGCDLADYAEAEDAAIVDRHGDRLAFRHPLLRATVYQTATPAVRRHVHTCIAAVLGERDLDRRAWHLSEATISPDEDVADALDQAARSALDRGAYDVAAGRFDRAATLTPELDGRARRLAEAGEAAWLGGRTDRALELLGRAGETATDPRTRNRAVALRGVVSARCGSLADARDLLLEATCGSESMDPDEAVALLAEAVYACIYLCDRAALQTAVDGLDALAPRTSTERAGLLSDLASGMGLIMLGSGRAGADRIRRAIPAGRLLVDGDPRWLPWLLLAPMWLRESGSARSLMGAGVADARRRAALGTLPFLLFHEARDDATTDRWAAAEASFREAISLAAETGQHTDEGMALAGLVWLLARQGHEDDCRALAEVAVRSCSHSDLNMGLLWVEYALGDLAAGLGRPEAAVERYTSQLACIDRLAVTDPDLSPAAELVECLVSIGEGDQAAALAQDFSAQASRKGQPWSKARAARGLAIAGIDSELNFTLALAEHEQTPDAYEQARTQLAFGAFLRRDRRRKEARVWLRAALGTFDQLGATPWGRRAAAELAATGERVQHRSGEGAQSLTPQEFQIATLLVDGRTTREAAASLFLSPKTVEYHLRHVYIKLGISSRRELAEHLAVGRAASGEPMDGAGRPVTR